MKKRYLIDFIRKDIQEKMVFLAGPRQVGKTTLAKTLLAEYPSGKYYNWDNREDRKEMRKAHWPLDARLVVVDELHKERNWKRWIKGEFDKHREQFRFLVTGSARMDIYRRGGDSLQGRYHHYRLHPISLAEAMGFSYAGEVMHPISLKKEGDLSILQTLLEFGGFPEPFLKKDLQELRRWQHERLDRLVQEDIRDLERVMDLTHIEMLADLLVEKASGLLSLNSLREDLEVSHRAVTHWVNILERMYYCFRIPPFASKRVHSLKKENKLYLWDYSLIPDHSLRFENLIASHLLKFCHFLEDVHGYEARLYYLRDLDKREVDFLVTLKDKPWFAVEAKTQERIPSSSLFYFSDRIRIPYLYQVVLGLEEPFQKDNVGVVPAHTFLANLI